LRLTWRVVLPGFFAQVMVLRARLPSAEAGARLKAAGWRLG
jgi:hypothetical protein